MLGDYVNHSKILKSLATQSTHLTANKELVHSSLQIIRNKDFELAKSNRILVQFSDWWIAHL
jgi:hypothetical protein